MSCHYVMLERQSSNLLLRRIHINKFVILIQSLDIFCLTKIVMGMRYKTENVPFLPFSFPFSLAQNTFSSSMFFVFFIPSCLRTCNSDDITIPLFFFLLIVLMIEFASMVALDLNFHYFKVLHANRVGLPFYAL